PFVSFYVGAPVVRVQAPPPVIVPQPVPAVPLPTLPPPTLLLPSVLTPIPVDQFAASFQPKPGNYEVVFVHTKTCQPVKVCFSLPDGCPKKVRVTKHVLEFDYGKIVVRIRFLHNGDVKVVV